MRRPMPPERRELIGLAVALVLAMSTWFSTAAVLGQLRSAWALSDTQASWLTIVVQLGFVAGAVGSSVSNLADRIRPLRLVFAGSLGAAAANGLIVPLDSFETAVVLRFATGAFLALVYPPALKSISGWFREGRGLALGVLIGALTIGSALPHLINALGGLSWQATLVLASVLTVLGGLIAERRCVPGPFATPSAPFDPSALGLIVRDRSFRLASAGYFGHMWELYAMWAWIAAFYGDVFESTRAASLAAFAAIAIGAGGAVYAGTLSDRRSRPRAAGLAMKWSAAAALITGFVVDAPPVVPVLAGLVWGFWVIADSAQFSAIVSESCDQRYVGTALTLQLAAGFVLTVFTIFLVPVVRDAAGWGWAFALLVPGPILGAWAMRRLGRAPAAVEEPSAV
ncbi:MAG: MFS transporter [Ilumatobacter sp.]